MHLASDAAVKRRTREHAGHLRRLRPALAGRALDDWRCPTATAAGCWPSSSRAARPGARRRTTRATARRCSRRARSRASRGSWPSGSTRPTSRAGARAPGSRSRTSTAQEVVIGGCTPGEGGRAGHARRACAWASTTRMAALKYAGKVGTGFTETTLGTVLARAEPLRREDSPFDGRQPPRGTRFVEPRLVAEVEFREWTRTGTLRAAVVQGPARRRGPGRGGPRDLTRRSQLSDAAAWLGACASLGTVRDLWHARSGAGRSASAS